MSDDKVQESDKGLDYSMETQQFPSARSMCHTI
jgi:hypothetical protein